MARHRTADGRRGWRQWSEPEAREALAQFARSGESLGAFARRSGVSEQRLRYWQKRVTEPDTPSFVAVPVTSARGAQIEIASPCVTVRVREDLDLVHMAELVAIVATRGRIC